MKIKYFLGLDIGQAHEMSALAILERRTKTDEDEKLFHCRHLKRWQQRTPYPAIIEEVGRLIASDELRAGNEQPGLAVDATGVGAPLVQLIRRAQMKARLWPVLITAGDIVGHESGFWRVPKRELASNVQLALQSERLKIAPELKEAATLTREMMGFQVKVTLDASQDSYAAWREGADDDLVLAVAVALWAGERDRPEQIVIRSYSGVSFGSGPVRFD